MSNWSPSGADGAHLTGIEAMEDALPSLKPDRIAGVGGLTTRHDSMAAGEAGADSCCSANPMRAGSGPHSRRSRNAEWWAELFSLVRRLWRPSREEIGELCGSRRGFLSGPRFHLTDPRGAAAAVAGCRAGDQTGADAMSGKVKPNRNSAGNEDPAPISILLSCLILTANAAAQVSLTPPGVDTPPAADKPAAKPKAKPPVQAKKARRLPPRQRSPRAPAAAPAAAALPPCARRSQCGSGVWRLPARAVQDGVRSGEQTREDFSDPKAMTCSRALRQRDGRQAGLCQSSRWYKRAADGGDREGMFRWRCFGSAGAAARSIARKPLNCWRPRQARQSEGGV